MFAATVVCVGGFVLVMFYVDIGPNPLSKRERERERGGERECMCVRAFAGCCAHCIPVICVYFVSLC